jgi:acyl-[acyl-carrier-protein]-phospholipid O-acyltransferase/long-chain-fatty-acid--[acyl-carrier-protein] ligase
VDSETLQPLAAGQTGLLLVNGPSRMIGYLGQATYEGYYNTGDLGYIDADGFLYVVDRLSRFSKIAGEMVPHLKVEVALNEILGEKGCVVTGIPDERRGERLAVIYIKDAVTPAQMVRHLESAKLPALWIPKRENFYLIDALPQLGTGKLDLKAVRNLAITRAEAA